MSIRYVFDDCIEDVFEFVSTIFQARNTNDITGEAGQEIGSQSSIKWIFPSSTKCDSFIAISVFWISFAAKSEDLCLGQKHQKKGLQRWRKVSYFIQQDDSSGNSR